MKERAEVALILILGLMFGGILVAIVAPFNDTYQYSCYDSNGTFARTYEIDPKSEKAGYPIEVWEQSPGDDTAHKLYCYRPGNSP